MGLVTKYFPDIKKITLIGFPGIINNIYKIEELKNLQSVSFYDIFGYNDDDVKVFGKLEELSEIDFYRVPGEAGRYIRKYWKDRFGSLSVLELRNDG